MMGNKTLIILLVFLAFYSCKSAERIDAETTLPFFNSAEFTPEWITEDSKKYASIHTIPDFEFTNQNGDKITKETYKDKIYVADFFFTSCPGICPRLAKNMGELQEVFKDDKDVLLLSHSVTPVKDSVPVLKAYAKENNVNSSKWNLVTGDKDEIYKLARTAYFADEDFVKTQDESAFIHTENFILIDQKGRIRGVYNGTLAIETDRILRHIKLLKKETK
jgi:protein SCO1/2